jgi:hypothetical protein
MKRKPHKVKLLMLLLFSSGAMAQPTASSFSFTRSSEDLSDSLFGSIRYEAGLAATASLANGPMISEFKSKYQQNSPEVAATAKSTPLYFAGFFANAVYRPFQNEPLSKLAVVAGLQYYKRGFTMLYEQDYSHKDKSITDLTNYRETFKFNQIGIPISVRYGKKYFAEMGVCYNVLFGSSKIASIVHEQTGNDAYKGGFTISDRERFVVSSDLIDRRSTNFILGLGAQLNSLTNVKLEFMRIGKTFLVGSDFNNTIIQFKISKRIKSK